MNLIFGTNRKPLIVKKGDIVEGIVFLKIMTNHATGPCDLGDRCSGPEFEIRAKYKCCFCGFQLHNPMSGCSRAHGEDVDKVNVLMP